MSEDDTSLWDRVTQTIAPLKGRRDSPVTDPLPPKPKRRKAEGKAVSLPPVLQPGPAKAQKPQVDGHVMRKLRAGKMPIEGRLDLHGETRDKAKKLLDDFIQASQSRGRRCVLVITGKGTRRRSDEEWIGVEPGILHQLTPQWLAANPLVLASCPARPEDGGDGALYVYLKRNR